MFRYAIPVETLAELISRVAVASHGSNTLATTTARAILAHLEPPDFTTPASHHLGQNLGGEQSTLSPNFYNKQEFEWANPALCSLSKYRYTRG